MNIKQVVVSGQNQVSLQDVDLNETLGPDEFLVETECTFISAGTELANYTGKEKLVFVSGSWCAYPWRSGYSNVGIVRKIGANVTKVRPGQRVFTFGPHASFTRAHQGAMVCEVPAGIDPVLAAASRIAAVAMTAPLVAEIAVNSSVAVFGLGMVGNIAAQAFKVMGCRVIGVEPNASRRRLAEKCGIERTVGGTTQEVHQAIKEMTGGTMASITVEAAGHSAVALEALQATATFGQLILLGSPRVPVQGNLTDMLSDVHLRWVTVRGALEWCLPTYPAVGSKYSLYGKQQTIFDWMQRGLLKLEPQVSHRLKPAQIKEAYDGLLNKPDVYTGVVLDWR
ncbi:MAG TPA: zinc-binding dehydrogenase [Planctomycetota bacterium]|nr:zinc-binding dehydrogenase [Planctomycetota bacterium]